MTNKCIILHAARYHKMLIYFKFDRLFIQQAKSSLKITNSREGQSEYRISYKIQYSHNSKIFLQITEHVQPVILNLWHSQILYRAIRPLKLT